MKENVSKTLTLFVGSDVGFEVGVGMGKAVGFDVGLGDGLGERVFVGSDVGIFVGFDVGFELGLVVVDGTEFITSYLASKWNEWRVGVYCPEIQQNF